jgi:hypothetical protein
MSHQTVTRSILNAYFPRIYSLQAYLNFALNPLTGTEFNDVLLLPTDTSSYGHFLAHSYVTFRDEVPPTDQDTQVITRAQKNLFSGAEQKGVDVITMGYRGVCSVFLRLALFGHAARTNERSHRVGSDCNNSY